VLDALRAHAGAGLLLPVGVLVLAAALFGRRDARVLAWAVGSAALVAALLLPDPVPAIVTAAVAVAVAVYGWRHSRPLVGLAWLGLAALLLAAGRPWFVAAALLVLLGAYVILRAAGRWRGRRPGAPVAYGTGFPPPDEVPAS
jgi:hypothetical protein